ncbi:zinc-binding alcohol dehydrogenase family protein [Dactylosporangium siamense]|uniref:Oxidoreductase n=1 Tax=Dactylosporangium siamense TaxID=685454 RepID=A0A919PI01_9ACTN|nr:zinc-binding alcohol dehydrogenase family protein [Dactylosporangium siamense]GIG42578.1 oxidoreductase [Dactylosporangium siamense]
MKAVRLHAFGADPVLDEVADPDPAAGETLVRITAAAAGHLDRTIIAGDFLDPPPLPYVPGVEGAGVVVSSGRHPAGTAVWVRGGGLGVSRAGTWAELVAVPDDAVHPMPDGCDPRLAACFFTAVTTAHVALTDVAGLRAGERVAVTGAAGSVGAVVVQLAAAAGAASITGLVSDAGRAAQVPPPGRAVIGTDPGDVDLLIDTMGGPDLPAILRHVVPGGRAVLVGYVSGTRLELDLSQDLIQRDVTLLPVNMLRRQVSARAAARGLLERLSRGDLRLPVTEFPLADVAPAMRALAAGEIHGRLVLLP